MTLNEHSYYLCYPLEHYHLLTFITDSCEPVPIRFHSGFLAHYGNYPTLSLMSLDFFYFRTASSFLIKMEANFIAFPASSPGLQRRISTELLSDACLPLTSTFIIAVLKGIFSRPCQETQSFGEISAYTKSLLVYSPF